MKIIGTGRSHPSLVVTNEMLSQFLDTSDEWITSRTGIKERRVISSENLEDLAIEAQNQKNCLWNFLEEIKTDLLCNTFQFL